MNKVVETVRNLQQSIYAFALGWMCAWFMSWLSATLVGIVAILIFVVVLSMTGVLHYKKAPAPPVFVSTDEDTDFVPIDDLEGEFTGLLED